MSWSFVLWTVIYYSFPLIDVYELKHKMILKCTLIEAAVDSVTRDPPPTGVKSGAKLPSHRSGRQRTGQSRPPEQWAGAEAMWRFIFIGSEGEGAPSQGPHNPEGLCGPDRQGWLSWWMGNRSQITPSF